MMLNQRGSGYNWADALARAETLGLPAFEGLLAGLVFKTVTRQPGLSEDIIRARLLNLNPNSVIAMVLVSEGVSVKAQPEKALARIGVAVANLKEVQLWPWQ